MSKETSDALRVKRDYKRNWALKNKESVKKSRQKWLMNNKEKRHKYLIKWKKENKEYNKIYFQKNKKRLQEMNREWVRKNISKNRGYQRKYNKNNPDICYKNWKKSLERQGNKLYLSNNKYKTALMYWSKAVIKRDRNICQICGSNEKLNAHHIFFRSLNPLLSLNINNGITLCMEHHREVHGWK